MTTKATGVLLAWRRLDNLRPIVAGMLDAGLREVVVWSNRSHGTTIELRHQMRRMFPHSNVFVCGVGRNLYTLGRYLAANLAYDEVIATCDDDCLVGNWQGLLDTCHATGELVVNIDAGHYDAYVGRRWTHPFEGGTAFEALVGWGAAFPRDSVRVLDLYLKRFGVDDLLIRKADRFFTILQARQPIYNRRAAENLPGATDAMALYRQRDHYKLTRLAQKRALEILSEEQACIES